MIHCIGDSHASIFSGDEEMQPIWPKLSNNKLEWFKAYRIGPATAYQLKNKESIINKILYSNLSPTDKVLFCFGEVDCRAHLKKQMDFQNRPAEHIVYECVSRYFSEIKKYSDTGFNVMVWGPIASRNDSKPYDGPSFGTNLERNEITRLFNVYLKDLCDGDNIPFITLFYDMLNDDGTTNTDLLDKWENCHIHLSGKGIPLIIDKFKTQNLI